MNVIIYLILYSKFILIHNILKKKTSNSVYREGPSLCTQILNEKSAFSPATDVFEK